MTEQGVDFAAGGHGGLGSAPGGGESAGGVGEVDGFAEGAMTFAEMEGECGTEGVTGGGGVDGLHGEGWEERGFDEGVEEGAALAAFEDGDGGDGIPQERIEASDGGFVVGARSAAERGGFGFVGGDDVDVEIPPIAGEAAGRDWGGIENGEDLVFLCDENGLAGGIEGDLELDEKGVGGSDDGFDVADVLGSEAGVGAGDDGDGVLAGFFDADEGDAAGGVGDGLDVAGIDAFVVETADELGTEDVIADAPDQDGATAEAGDGDGLVRSFAAGAGGERGAGERLAWLGEFGHLSDEVHVDGTNDHDAGWGALHGAKRS